MVFSRLLHRYNTRFHRPPTANPHSMATRKMRKSLPTVLLLLASVLLAGAQNTDQRDRRDNRSNQTFDKGVRSGGRGGQYNGPQHGNNRYNPSQYNNGRYNNGQYDTNRQYE